MSIQIDSLEITEASGFTDFKGMLHKGPFLEFEIEGERALLNKEECTHLLAVLQHFIETGHMPAVVE